jgi:hypothetical protein
MFRFWLRELPEFSTKQIPPIFGRENVTQARKKGLYSKPPLDIREGDHKESRSMVKSN